RHVRGEVIDAVDDLRAKRDFRNVVRDVAYEKRVIHVPDEVGIRPRVFEARERAPEFGGIGAEVPAEVTRQRLPGEQDTRQPGYQPHGVIAGFARYLKQEAPVLRRHDTGRDNVRLFRLDMPQCLHLELGDQAILGAAGNLQHKLPSVEGPQVKVTVPFADQRPGGDLEPIVLGRDPDGVFFRETRRFCGDYHQWIGTGHSSYPRTLDRPGLSHVPTRACRPREMAASPGFRIQSGCRSAANLNYIKYAAPQF